MRSLAQPLLVGREALVIEACVGTVVLTPDDLTDLSADGAAAELMKRAAIALSAASRRRPRDPRLYDEDLDHRTRYRMMLRHWLRSAIDQDQFELHYQPLVDLQSSGTSTAEALIRWRRPPSWACSVRDLVHFAGRGDRFDRAFGRMGDADGDASAECLGVGGARSTQGRPEHLQRSGQDA